MIKTNRLGLIGAEGIGLRLVRFNPGSVPGEPNWFKGVYIGCKTLFHSFPPLVSLSSPFLPKKMLSSLSDGRCGGRKEIRRGGRPDQRGGGAASELKSSSFSNFFVLSLLLPFLYSILNLEIMRTTNPNPDLQKKKKKV